LRRAVGIRTRLAVARMALAAGGIALLAHDARAHLTQQELHFLYEVNRARHDPPGWAVEQGLGSRTGGDGQPTTLVGVEPRPPLAMNELLVDSAGSKAEEMAAANYFDHHSPVGPGFLFPNELVRSFGYLLPASIPFPGGGGFYSFPDDFNSLESIACGYGPGTQNLSLAIHALTLLIVDEGASTLGHRAHLLATNDLNSLFTEAGAGYGINGLADCHNYWAFHTGVTDPSGQFLTGVVFDDGDGDDLFDPGEGLAGVTVNVGAEQTTTNDAGGWSLAVVDGAHAVSCGGGGFAGTGSASVSVAGANRQVDCVSGFGGLYVDFVEVWEPPQTLSATLAVLVVTLLARRGRGA
jgi:hypothetical protein